MTGTLLFYKQSGYSNLVEYCCWATMILMAS